MTVPRKLTMAICIILISASTDISPIFPRLRSLEFNTSIRRGLDIVFVPEDYSWDEMSVFRETVDIYYRVLLSVSPFSEYRDRINVWRIDTSVDFGSARDPATNRILNVDACMVKRFVENAIDLDLDGDPPDDLIVVLVNDFTYGGSGAVDVVVTYTGEQGARVMMHELGHSFGRLGDEYPVNDEDYPIDGNILYANIDWDGGKWKDVQGTGAFQGAWYRNLVRPTRDSCIMRRIDCLQFCPVCTNALAALLERFSSSGASEANGGHA